MSANSKPSRSVDSTVLSLSDVREGNPRLRLDSDYFNQDAQKAYEALRGHQQLRDVIVDGYRVVYESTQILNPSDADYDAAPFFIQAADLETPFIRLDGVGRVRKEDWIRYPKGRIRPGELLVEVKGLAEKVALVPPDLQIQALVTGTCFKLQIDHPETARVLVAYLTSRPGQALKNRLKSNLLVAYIAKDDLYSLPIPKFGSKLRGLIAAEIDAAIEADSNVRKTFAAAEALVDSLLPKSPNVEHGPITVRRASAVMAAGRWDAEYFGSKFASFKETLVSAGAMKFTELGDLVTNLTNGHTPLRHDLSQGDVIFLGAEHVSQFVCDYESSKRILKEQHEGELARTKLVEGDILLTIKGRVGHAALVEGLPGDVNVNQDVAVLRLNDALPKWWVLAFLNSTLGRMQTEQFCTGGINPFLGLANVRRLRIPSFPGRVMDEVASSCERLVNESRRLKAELQTALETARTAVEVGINDGEKPAIRMLEGDQ